VSATNTEFLSLARRALSHLVNKTTDQAHCTMTLPVEAYIDPARYEREVERIFKHSPLALALSIELPAPRHYRAMTVVGTPVLLVRAEDGVARAFLNVCRHRGATLCEEGRGTAQRFICPSHAWRYNLQGKLTGITDPEKFGEIDAGSRTLVELPSAERAGLIWVSLTPNEPFDIEDWLCGFGEQLDTLQLGGWHLHEQREIPGPGWKVTWDGYLEAYHHNTVHANTLAKHTIGNLMLHDTYGPHQRLTMGRRTLGSLSDIPESQWDPQTHLRLIHSVFPNVSVSGILGDHCLVSQLFPGPTPDRTITRQSVLAAREPVTQEQKAATAAFSAMALEAVRDEDYKVGLRIQAGLKSGANKVFTFGRNEPAIQHYHRWVRRLVGCDVAENEQDAAQDPALTQ